MTRIVIDLQGAQSSGSRHRGIGRYSLALTEGLLRLRGPHTILVVLNGAFGESVEALRAQLASQMDARDIHVWNGVSGTAELPEGHSSWRREANERLREAFMLRLQPDVVLVTSLFEGLIDDATASVGRLPWHCPTAVVLYDLIPLINRKPYLENPRVQAWYERKVASLRRADCLLAISESSRQEALDHLGVPADACVNISTAADPRFRPLTPTPAQETDLRHRLGLQRPYVMYTGGIDHRKNIEGLIRAFAQLPLELRSRHQLAIVCAVQDADRQRLLSLARIQGLEESQLVLTGFVSDQDLLHLYNLCALFVFPSWHEGFGLPALEAMACGRPVLAARTSSLPEVVGNEEALFDPFDDADMAALMRQVLEDPDRAVRLGREGLARSALFSWDQTARRALESMLTLPALAPTAGPLSVERRRLPRLAVVTPLAPERTGIAEYNSELLPELARHFDITLISPQESTSDPWVLANAELRSPQWLQRNAGFFDHVLYHMGNSHFHAHVFDLIRRVPGVVMLHDFHLGQLVDHMHGSGSWPGDRTLSLYRNHGAEAVSFDVHGGEGEASWRYPCNLDILQHALGVIVHSEAARSLAHQWYGEAEAREWRVVPHLRRALPLLPRAQARAQLGLPQDAFVVCSFGLVGEGKLTARLVEAFAALDESSGPPCRLRLVGANAKGAYGAQVQRLVASAASGSRVEITGWADEATYRQHLAAADVAVQLRARSRGETSGALLDCMAAGLATVVNTHGSFVETGGAQVLALREDFEDAELTASLQLLRADEKTRLELGARARVHVQERHRPAACAALYAESVRHFYSRGRRRGFLLPPLIGPIGPADAIGVRECVELARTIAGNDAPEPRQPQLLVDVSVLAQVDAGTGIQRVVKCILRRWLVKPPAGLRVEPVRVTGDGELRYARRFTMGFIGAPEVGLQDPLVEAYANDHLLLLDYLPTMSDGHRAALARLRMRGIRVRFVVYDLLPVQMPHHFPEGVAEAHQRWLEATTASDGVVCISRAVADDYLAWLRHYGPPRPEGLDVDWFHLGADFSTDRAVGGAPGEGAAVLRAIEQHGAILMVGTLEPRKRQDQVLDAMELLWKEGRQERLVIVGKEGWKCATLASRIRRHPEKSRRLLWFDRASDAWLAGLYRAGRGLVAASEGEGFGLALVEAAQHGLPVLARDLPVFREVAAPGTTFFQAATGAQLRDVLRGWLETIAGGGHTEPLAPRSWDASAADLAAATLGPAERGSRRLWRHDGVFRYHGSDHRLPHRVGRNDHRARVTDGHGGDICYGPYLHLEAGTWRVQIDGAVLAPGARGCTIRATAEAGSNVLWSQPLPDGSTPARFRFEHVFSISRPVKNFEVVVRVRADDALRLDGLVIEPATVPSPAAL